jgi:Ala-tRNA(Pro) deacylase
VKVQQFLDSRGISFEMLPHEPTFSAQRMAQAVHVSGDNVAKTVLLKADGQFVLAVLPATHQIHLEMAREALAAHLLELADEDELAKVFSDCEVGAVPPFGTQYGIETLVDASLAEDDEIVFEGNAHRQAFRMKYRDFEDLENPQVAVFGYHQC